ncbi:REP-associated tyrosine transposase [Psychrobacter sp. FME5]|uniref:REP-associated tyrosine transposase n=1 Tax=Psychrobacter sp. FME5 TaxID=2487706 RepID=UPI001788632E|nr:transposase [Psychrobacter sp. FME5]MBE0444093.1 transposase [Psychrobacter sp. FME5]MDN5802842.1 transposase [Psychrobacter sp.]
MPRYIRSYTKGATYFFTLVSYNRRRILCEDDFLQAFKKSIKQVQQQYSFEIIAWVQLPDHLHCIWRLPENDADYSMRWSQIKRLTTQACPQYHLPINELSPSKVKRHERGIWQRRFYEHEIKNEADFIRHIDYLHYNPVKHGLVKKVVDWPYSSFHRYVRQGDYLADWGDDGLEFSSSFIDKLE